MLAIMTTQHPHEMSKTGQEDTGNDKAVQQRAYIKNAPSGTL